MVLEYTEKQRVSQPTLKRNRREFAKDQSKPFSTTADPSKYQELYDRYRSWMKQQCDKRVGWSDIFDNMSNHDIQQLFVKFARKRYQARHPAVLTVFDKAMPKPDLPAVYPDRPLNLNDDGTSITYSKSHTGPNSAHWLQADAEEIERLFTSGTLRPLMFRDIPAGKNATYVNPICSEKLRDTGAIKFRTRATIGGDQIDYPFNTTAVTANLESIKLLLNAMISDDINLSTVDLEDFYLGTPLPHPEYIRIPTRFIPPKVIRFYNLQQYIHKGALYCAVLKTHYGLPQAGALSQERLFQHLEKHGYHQLTHSQSLFRNHDGTIRFALVVDDFAVIWKDKQSMQHFLATLRKLYTVKVDWEGSKYLGMDIDINRVHRHVTISMATLRGTS
jgi:hypothetical protein